MMGKDMRKAKISGAVAVMEVPNQSSVGVRTRARTLALQRLQKPTADPASYLELRSRRLEKPFVATAARAKEVCKEKPSPSPKSSSNASSKGSTSPGGQLAEGLVNSGSAGSVSARSCCLKKGDASPEIEVSYRDNFLEHESGRNARETTPCSLIREPESIEAPSSTNKPTKSTGNSRRARNSTGRDTLAALELEEFFAGAEQPQQRQFAEKYNYDPVTDQPLPGRYEWMKLD
ncbi:cyclin-dependent kinase inhibitor 5-like [Phoenix dactylifera]|uniref:Cyclin-dependent kinase inhibitor 5-like n=1 Tax=Phoenix dactylifera TaxID=42345 RepID=A0A8B7C108_PHODC|nr:cyclin-dependent kinase inhibitor 5-like [Phoenix dactylifera]